ncbi:MAG: DUF4388 domain-containing protein [Thermoanaerobaculia bacterium]|nr:DUF4388 domain-containing protein [Thermoanaerobaculia bacterium]
MSDAALQGSLAAFKVADVLTVLSTARKSGTLTVMSYDLATRVVFAEGALVYAESDQERFRLGAILLRQRKITREQVVRIDAAMRRDGARFGQIAVDEGLLSADELRDALKVQVSEVIFDTFVWTVGTFAFIESTRLPEYAVTITIDLANLIMEGSRRIEEWQQCVELLPDSSVVFRVVSAPKDDKITLTADEWKLLFLVNGQRTIDDLVQDSDEPPLHVYRVLYGLYANKLIEIVRSSPAPEELPANPDETMRQTAPMFYRDATIRDEDPGDDTSLLVSRDATLSYSDVARTIVAQLVVDPDAPRVIPLTEPEYLIGRHSDNHVQLSDPGISSFHARVFRSRDAYVVEDMKSRNGTWLNGNQIIHSVLKNGDVITLGATELKYEVLIDQDK